MESDSVRVALFMAVCATSDMDSSSEGPIGV
jgi:hypothetical protein